MKLFVTPPPFLFRIWKKKKMVRSAIRRSKNACKTWQFGWIWFFRFCESWIRQKTSFNYSFGAYGDFAFSGDAHRNLMFKKARIYQISILPQWIEWIMVTDHSAHSTGKCNEGLRKKIRNAISQENLVLFKNTKCLAQNCKIFYWKLKNLIEIYLTIIQ